MRILISSIFAAALCCVLPYAGTVGTGGQNTMDHDPVPDIQVQGRDPRDVFREEALLRSRRRLGRSWSSDRRGRSRERSGTRGPTPDLTIQYDWDGFTGVTLSKSLTDTKLARAERDGKNICINVLEETQAQEFCLKFEGDQSLKVVVLVDNPDSKLLSVSVDRSIEPFTYTVKFNPDLLKNGKEHRYGVKILPTNSRDGRRRQSDIDRNKQRNRKPICYIDFRIVSGFSFREKHPFWANVLGVGAFLGILGCCYAYYCDLWEQGDLCRYAKGEEPERVDLFLQLFGWLGFVKGDPDYYCK